MRLPIKSGVTEGSQGSEMVMWRKGIAIALLGLLTACQMNNPYGFWKREATAPVDPVIRVSAAASRLQSDYGECLLYVRSVNTTAQYQNAYSSTSGSAYSSSLSTDQQQQVMDNCMRSKGWVRAAGPVASPNGEKFSLDPFRNTAPQPQPMMMNPVYPQQMMPYPYQAPMASAPGMMPAPVQPMPQPAPQPQSPPAHSEPGFTYYGRAMASPSSASSSAPRRTTPSPSATGQEEPIYIK